MSRRRPRWAALALAAGMLAACGSSRGPSPTVSTSFQPVALHGTARGLPLGIVTDPFFLRSGDAPDGPELRDDLGHPIVLDPGRLVVPLSAPQSGPDGSWVRAWIAPSTTVWPGDFIAWVQLTNRGLPTVQLLDAPACPPEATIRTLASLTPPDRLACAGPNQLTFDARTWFPGVVATYDVDPPWYGTNANAAGTTSLFDPGPIGFGPGAAVTPDQAGSWIDARVPPDVPRLPVGVLLRVTGQFDDPTAATCHRTLPNGFASMGLPVEAVADSVTWCREQFVVHAWQAVLGSEGRPFDPADPQLHRNEFVVPPGAAVACGGVGMPPLTIRIDPAQVEPVWIDLPDGRRSVARFSSDFHLLPNPTRVQASDGATLVDREVLDPDRGKPGIAICPEGHVVDFDLPPA